MWWRSRSFVGVATAAQERARYKLGQALRNSAQHGLKSKKENGKERKQKGRGERNGKETSKGRLRKRHVEAEEGCDKDKTYGSHDLCIGRYRPSRNEGKRKEKVGEHSKALHRSRSVEQDGWQKTATKRQVKLLLLSTALILASPTDQYLS